MSVNAVFLVGFMASGKTTLGTALARRLGWDFVDLDAAIESREGHTIQQIFRERGESEFRKLEASALSALTRSLECNTVVALGGGTFAYGQNREFLQQWPSVFLEAPVEELWQRSLKDAAKRPLRKDVIEFGRLYEDRLPHYRRATVTIVTSGRDTASLCAEIESILLLRGSVQISATTKTPPAHFGTGEEQ
jgi:shikimate kinase